jgi:hypothetical protein
MIAAHLLVNHQTPQKQNNQGMEHQRSPRVLAGEVVGVHATQHQLTAHSRIALRGERT